MGGMRDFGNALVAAILSIGLTLGALSISLVGFVPEEVPSPTPTLIFSPIEVPDMRVSQFTLGVL